MFLSSVSCNRQLRLKLAIIFGLAQALAIQSGFGRCRIRLNCGYPLLCFRFFLNFINPTICVIKSPYHKKFKIEPILVIPLYRADSLNPKYLEIALRGLITLLLVSPKSSRKRENIAKHNRVIIKYFFTIPSALYSFLINFICKIKQIMITIPFRTRYHPTARNVQKVKIKHKMVRMIGFNFIFSNSECF